MDHFGMVARHLLACPELYSKWGYLRSTEPNGIARSDTKHNPKRFRQTQTPKSHRGGCQCWFCLLKILPYWFARLRSEADFLEWPWLCRCVARSASDSGCWNCTFFFDCYMHSSIRTKGFWAILKQWKTLTKPHCKTKPSAQDLCFSSKPQKFLETEHEWEHHEIHTIPKRGSKWTKWRVSLAPASTVRFEKISSWLM